MVWRTVACWAAVSGLVAEVAAAAPLTVSHQGRVSDASGQPIHGERRLDFALWDAPVDGALVWSEIHHDVPVDSGYFQVVLGSLSGLDASHFNGEGRWLSVAVDGQVLGARTPVLSVPYAIHSDTTAGVATGEVHCERSGQVRYHAGVLALCDGSEWRAVPVRGALGRSEALPAASCADVLASDPSATTGTYWIAAGGAPFEVHCDMQMNGGGWTLVATIADDGNHYWTPANWPELLTDSAYGSLQTAATEDFKSPAWGRVLGDEVLISKDAEAAWIRYDTILSRARLSDVFVLGNVQTEEHAAALSVGSWWFQCSNLNLRLHAKDSDGNDMWSKGFTWRSTNNNGCSYDDLQGALSTTSSAVDSEAYWGGAGFYEYNFGGGAARVWVR